MAAILRKAPDSRIKRSGLFAPGQGPDQSLTSPIRRTTSTVIEAVSTENIDHIIIIIMALMSVMY